MMWDMMAPMWWMWLLWLLVLVLIIAGILLAVRAVAGGSRARPSASPEDEDTAVRFLQERYARGEIDEDEYRERRRVLEERDTSAT